jgi:hypothetical protein
VISSLFSPEAKVVAVTCQSSFALTSINGRPNFLTETSFPLHD